MAHDTDQAFGGGEAVSKCLRHISTAESNLQEARGLLQALAGGSGRTDVQAESRQVQLGRIVDDGASGAEAEALQLHESREGSPPPPAPQSPAQKHVLGRSLSDFGPGSYSCEPSSPTRRGSSAGNGEAFNAFSSAPSPPGDQPTLLTGVASGMQEPTSPMRGLASMMSLNRTSRQRPRAGSAASAVSTLTLPPSVYGSEDQDENGDQDKVVVAAVAASGQYSCGERSISEDSRATVASTGEQLKRQEFQDLWCQLDDMGSAKDGYIDQVMIANRKNRSLRSTYTHVDTFPTQTPSSSPSASSTPGKSRFGSEFSTGSEDLDFQLDSGEAKVESNRCIQFVPLGRRCWWFLIPVLFPQSKQRIVWIFFGVFCIMYECIAVPILLCFDTEAEGGFKVMGDIISVYFLADVCISFFTAYVNDRGDMVLEPAKVVAKYLKTWFMPDIAASLPLEWIMPGGGKSLRLMRFLRLLRLARLVRIMKLKSIMNTVEARMEGSTLFRFSSRLLKLLGFLTMSMHWCACLWYFVGNLETHEKSWVEQFLEDLDYTHLDQKYVWSLYFTLTTMTTVGYGDISPQTFTEAKFALFLLPAASVIFATLMGALTDLITSLNAAATKRADQRMLLAHYMNWRAVPARLRLRIRTYMIFVWDATRDWPAYEGVLKVDLSPVLREELCMHIHGKVLTKVPFLAWMQGFPVCIRQLASLLSTRHIDRNDHLFQVGTPCTTVYVLTVGSMWLSLNQTVHQAEEDDTLAIPRKSSEARIKGADKLSPMSAAGKNRTTTNRTTTMNLAQPRHNDPVGLSGKVQDWAMATTVIKKKQKKSTRQVGYNIFDGEVFNEAHIKLQLHDLRVKHIVLRLQQNWRRRQEKRAESKRTRGPRVSSQLSAAAGGINMRSHMVNAPSYFGECCLWVPLEQWPEFAPKHMYNARCDKRGELVCIPRSAIETVLLRFSPWLPERFEFFREHVVELLKETVAAAAAAGPWKGQELLSPGAAASSNGSDGAEQIGSADTTLQSTDSAFVLLAAEAARMGRPVIKPLRTVTFADSDNQLPGQTRSTPEDTHE